MNQNGDPEITTDELLSLLTETGARIDAMRKQLDTLRTYRDQLLLVGKELDLSVAEMARMVGMRREQAHYAIVRARAEALEQALKEEGA